MTPTATETQFLIVGAWGQLPDAERRRIMTEVLPLRERRGG